MRGTVKALFAVLLVLSSASLASAQVTYDTITATVTDPASHPYANASYAIRLVDNFGRQVYAATTPNGQPFACKPVTGNLDSTGYMSVQLVPNNTLTDSVTRKQDTNWQITIGRPGSTDILTVNDPASWQIIYSANITAPVDLSSQLSSLAGQINFINLRTGQSVVGGDFSAPSYNNVIEANAQAGSDACAKINAAEAALPSTGGAIDARGFQGTQTCAGTIGPLTKMGKLTLGSATFLVQSPVIIESQAVTVEGGGWQAEQTGGSQSVIQAGTSFSGTDVIQIGGNNANVSGTNISHLQVNCNSLAGTNGIGLSPGSGVAIYGTIDRVYSENCPGSGLYAVGAGTFDWTVIKSRFEYNGTGVTLESNAWRFVSDEVDNNTTDGYHIDDSFAISISGDVETNGVNNIHFTNHDGNVSGVSIQAVYFEPSSSPATQDDIRFEATGTHFFLGIDVGGSYFQGDNITPYAIVFPSTLYVEGAMIHGNNFAGYTTDAVNNQGGAEATFAGNYWGG